MIDETELKMWMVAADYKIESLCQNTNRTISWMKTGVTMCVGMSLIAILAAAMAIYAVGAK